MIDNAFLVIGGNARRSRSQPCPAATVTMLSRVPAVGIRSVPGAGLRSVPDTGLRSVPVTGLRSVPVPRLRSVPVVGLRSVPVAGLGSVPVVVGPFRSRAASGTTGVRLLGCPLWTACARPWLRPRLRLRLLLLRGPWLLDTRLRSRPSRGLGRLRLLLSPQKLLLLRRLRRLLLRRLARRPGVTIGRRQGCGPHRPEFAQPLFGGEIGAIIRLLAIVPPPAHRLPPHPRTAKFARTAN